MIYFKESLNLLSLFGSVDTMDYPTLKNKSTLKEPELRKLLSYLLFNEYIEIFQNTSYKITDIGKRFVFAFGQHEKAALSILTKLRNVYPQTLTKKQCSEGMSVSVFKDVFAFLKEKSYIYTNNAVSTQELVRLGEIGFVMIDYFKMQSKLYSIMDDE